jgi:hypothetical protein
MMRDVIPDLSVLATACSGASALGGGHRRRLQQVQVIVQATAPDAYTATALLFHVADITGATLPATLSPPRYVDRPECACGLNQCVDCGELNQLTGRENAPSFLTSLLLLPSLLAMKRNHLLPRHAQDKQKNHVVSETRSVLAADLSIESSELEQLGAAKLQELGCSETRYSAEDMFDNSLQANGDYRPAFLLLRLIFAVDQFPVRSPRTHERMLQQQRLTTVLLSRLQYAIDIDGVRGVQRDRNDDYIEFRAQARAPTPEYAEGAMELFVDFWTNGGGGGGGGGGGTCQYANDGECDEPDLCAVGTDGADCGGSGGGGGGGGGDNSCEYAFDEECDDGSNGGVVYCARGTDSSDCDGVGR